MLSAYAHVLPGRCRRHVQRSHERSVQLRFVRAHLHDVGRARPALVLLEHLRLLVRLQLQVVRVGLLGRAERRQPLRRELLALHHHHRERDADLLGRLVRLHVRELYGVRRRVLGHGDGCAPLRVGLLSVSDWRVLRRGRLQVSGQYLGV
jgi:hypothetical protein